jgi:hypothetical protein
MGSHMVSQDALVSWRACPEGWVQKRKEQVHETVG